MKKALNTLNLLLLTSVAALAGVQDPNVDRVTIPLADPNRPAVLSVGLIAGSISVKAHSGKDVIVEIRQQLESSNPKEKTQGGLRLIPNTSSGLTVEQEGNTVEVGVGMAAMHREKQLIIQVPVNTSVKLSTVNDGDIEVEGINGEIEVNNINGAVYLRNISGSAVAHALNGDLVATFQSVTPNKSMSFSSLNGKIDVTFPPSVKATINLKSEQGEIYTDFDVVMEKTATKIEEEGTGKRKRIVIEKGMRGTINGGGAEILFKNFNGDIYIRKGK
ncbi:MAG: DUF4097 family beta strand repeat-containing protein [Bacteroidota bacterium]